MFIRKSLPVFGTILVALLLLFALPAMAQQNPSPEPACVPNLPEDWLPYTVQKGDILSGIAVRAQIRYRLLAELNCITNPNRLRAGQVLFVPPLFYHHGTDDNWNGLHQQEQEQERQRNQLCLTDGGCEPNQVQNQFGILNGNPDRNREQTQEHLCAQECTPDRDRDQDRDRQGHGG